MKNDWEKIRSNYPLLEEYTYLNTASTGLLSRTTVEAVHEYTTDHLHHAAIHRPLWLDKIASARQSASKLIRCKNDELAFVPDVSIGMSMVANALRDVGSVCLLEDDFPSVGLPWLAAGYQVTWVSRDSDQSIPYQRIEDALSLGVKVLAISWVHYNSGIATDLALLGDMCRKHGALLIVDGTQGIGALQMDVKLLHIDILIGSTFKWLTGGYGTALLYVSKDIESALSPSALGWNSLQQFDIPIKEKGNWKTGAAQFEAGHYKYPALFGLENALREILEIGMEAIENRIFELTAYLLKQLNSAGLEVLTPNPEAHGSGIITIKADRTLFQHLADDSVITTHRDQYVRLSVHFYNNFDDIDKLTASLSRYSHP